MNRVLVATDTCKEAIMLMEDAAKILYKNKILFNFDKYRMIIKANDSVIVFAPKTSGHTRLYQVSPFDYFMLTGEAGWEGFDWYKKCISRTENGSMRFYDWNELIKVIAGR